MTRNKAGFIGPIALLTLFQGVVHAIPFSISPTPGTALPTQVTQGQTTTALYTIKNNTSSLRTDNYIRSLPTNVTQILANSSYPDLCGPNFQLQPKSSVGDSCTLQLLIHGAVNGYETPLFACFPGGTTCAGTPTPLSVATVNPLPVIAAGGFSASILNQEFIYDVLTSLDHGMTWTQRAIPQAPGYIASTLQGMSCQNGSCLGVGSVQDELYNQFPVVVVSANNGVSWAQQILQVPDGFSNGSLAGITCRNALCQAVGTTYTNTTSSSRILVATTQNAGAVWSQEVLDLEGSMYGITCQGSTCISVGNFIASEVNVPGIITSTNQGPWLSRTTPFPDTAVYGALSSVSCSDSACIAVGSYADVSVAIQTAIYVSTNLGSTWTQQPQLNFTGYSEAAFTGISCSSGYCVAVGYAINPPNSNNPSAPVLAVSNAEGTSWSQQIVPTPSPYTSCTLAGVTCSGTTCTAVGGCSSETAASPFVVVSTDNGVTWSEQLIAQPAESYAQLFSVG